jgi:alanine dehydrogenase
MRRNIASKGYEKAAAEDPGIAEGVNLVQGKVTNRAVADSFKMKLQAIK